MNFHICPECGSENTSYHCPQCGRVELTPEQRALDVKIMQGVRTAEFDQLRADRSRLQAEVERLTKERDQYVRAYDLLGEELEQMVDPDLDGTSLQRLRRLAEERDSLAAEVSRLERVTAEEHRISVGRLQGQLELIKERDNLQRQIGKLKTASGRHEQDMANCLANVVATGTERDLARSQLQAVERERDDVSARATLEAQHHHHLRKERDEARATVDKQALHITHLVMQLRGKDWHEEIVATRATAEKMRAVVVEAALYCSKHGEDATSLDTALEWLFGAPVDAITESARDAMSARTAIDSALPAQREGET